MSYDEDDGNQRKKQKLNNDENEMNEMIKDWEKLSTEEKADKLHGNWVKDDAQKMVIMMLRSNNK